MTVRDMITDEVATDREIARWTGKALPWVQSVIRRLNIAPKYVVGQKQYTAHDVMRIVLLARLQDYFGNVSPLPYQIVASANAALSALYSNPDEGTIVSHKTGGPLRIVVSVPGLRELFAGVGAA